MRRLLLVLPLLAGCYGIGYQPYGGMTELAVPVFGNETLRRGLEQSLTRHVRRELLETTPIHLARYDESVPELRGAIVSVKEGLLVAGPAEEVLESSVNVTVRFGVYREGKLWIGLDSDGDGVPDSDYELTSFAEFDTTRGESRDTAAEETLRDLAEMVVFQLSARQDDRHEPNDTPARATELGVGQQIRLFQRNPDWFKLAIPPGKSLRVGLYAGADAQLTIAGADEQGQPLPDAELRDEGKLLLVPGRTGEAREVWIHVDGPNAGAEYTLWIWLQTAPPD